MLSSSLLGLELEPLVTDLMQKERAPCDLGVMSTRAGVPPPEDTSLRE